MDFKVGDVVRVRGGKVEAVVEAVRDGVVCMAGDSFGGWKPEYLELVSRPSEAEAASALKVGDRVRICANGKNDGRVDVVRRLVPYENHQGRHQGYELVNALGIYLAHELELLPPEPARPCSCFHTCSCRPVKPMTATFVRYERPSLHECGPGISKLDLPKPPTKHRERLMTTSWAPYADWDNLPDAE